MVERCSYKLAQDLDSLLCGIGCVGRWQSGSLLTTLRGFIRGSRFYDKSWLVERLKFGWISLRHWRLTWNRHKQRFATDLALAKQPFVLHWPRYKQAFKQYKRSRGEMFLLAPSCLPLFIMTQYTCSRRLTHIKPPYGHEPNGAACGSNHMFQAFCAQSPHW